MYCFDSRALFINSPGKWLRPGVAKPFRCMVWRLTQKGRYLFFYTSIEIVVLTFLDTIHGFAGCCDIRLSLYSEVNMMKLHYVVSRRRNRLI